MKDQKTVVKKVIDYIEKNIERDLDLDSISKNVGYSKFYLNRIFAEHTGITIYKYLQARRLTVAAEKLVKSNKPITQIAYEAGYDTQQSFSFAFKQIYLYPPKIYRDKGIFIPKQNRISMCCSHTSQYCNFTAKLNTHAACDRGVGPRGSRQIYVLARPKVNEVDFDSLPAEIKEVAA